MRAFVRFAILVIALIVIGFEGNAGVASDLGIKSLKSLADLRQYEASQVGIVLSRIGQYDTNTVKYTSLWKKTVYLDQGFTSYDQANQYARESLATGFGIVLTNSAKPFDKAKPLFVEVSMVHNMVNESYDTLNRLTNLSLTFKNGAYYAPDLGGFTVDLPGDVPIFVWTRWARIEASFVGETPFEILDNQIAGFPSATDPFSGIILIPRDFLTTANVQIKIFVLSDQYEVFDGHGVSIPLVPLKLVTAKYGEGMRLTVTGGSPQRSFRVQQSINLQNWVDVSQTAYVPSEPPNAISLDTVVKTDLKLGFFRLVETLETPVVRR